MKKNILIFVIFLLFLTNIYAQVGTPAPETFVSRTDNSVEKIIISQNNIGEITALSYQGVKDKKFVKLKILKIDNEDMRMTAQRPDTKEILTFSNSFIIGGNRFLPDGNSKEFLREIICKANTGEIITTSGGPMFMPYFYAPNATAPLKQLIINEEQIGKEQKLPTGEDYYEVTLPNKKGKCKIINMPYGDDNITKIKLITPDNKNIIFKSK